jgi:bifunctional DNA-binding transcriptional regulator/antitoxin component of YhaV-PrlF toxin-antitoxin module
MFKSGLTERVCFKTRLQRGNQVQVPKYVRWHYKLESTQILEVTVSTLGVWRPPQIFLSRISKDGRIVIPKLTITLFKDGRSSLGNYIAEVTLKPL